jgi:solute carrier family 35 protein E3
LQFNTVGFYQLSKILITPCVVLIEWLAYGKVLTRQQAMAIAVLMLGITIATMADSQVTGNPLGMMLAAAAVISSAFYQVLAGAKQKELDVNGNQLLHQSMPTAVALLTLAAPLMEPVGLLQPPDTPGTLLAFHYTPNACAWILLTAVLGLVVTLSAFLFIGASSAITYNVVGHSRTVLIVACGAWFFGDEVGLRKLLGVMCAVAGIVWYSVRAGTAAPRHSSSTGIEVKPLLPQWSTGR